MKSLPLKITFPQNAELGSSKCLSEPHPVGDNRLFTEMGFQLITPWQTNEDGWKQMIYIYMYIYSCIHIYVSGGNVFHPRWFCCNKTLLILNREASHRDLPRFVVWLKKQTAQVPAPRAQTQAHLNVLLTTSVAVEDRVAVSKIQIWLQLTTQAVRRFQFRPFCFLVSFLFSHKSLSGF